MVYTELVVLFLFLLILKKLTKYQKEAILEESGTTTHDITTLQADVTNEYQID